MVLFVYNFQSSGDYGGVSAGRSHQDNIVSLSILRTAKLEEMITEGEKQQPVTEGGLWFELP